MKKNIIYVMMILIYCVFFIGEDKASAAGTVPRNSSEFLTWVDTDYPGLFKRTQYSFKTNRSYSLNTSRYNADRLIFYGDEGDVSGIIGKPNDVVNGIYRFMGITNDLKYAFSNSDFKFDHGTDGNIKGRKYYTSIYNNRAGVKNNSFKPYKNDWNRPFDIWTAFNFMGKSMNIADATKLHNEWYDSIDDKYDRDHATYRTNSGGFWIERSTDNEFMKFSSAKRKSILFIIQPPTEYSAGTAAEWHQVRVGGATRHFYDIFHINAMALGQDNFKATKLDVKEISDGTYEVYFTVNNSSGKDVDTLADIRTSMSIQMGGSTFPIPDSTDFGSVWIKGQTKRVYMFVFSVDPSTPSNTPITVNANFNYDQAFPEKTYSDNSLSRTVLTAPNPTCSVGGVGESKSYQIRQSDYYYDSNGDIQWYSWCESRTAFLSHSAKVMYDNTRQTLLGTWSLNSKGHDAMDNEVPDAKKADFGNDKFNIKITNHGIPGITDPKRVIRAGRDVMMHSTMVVDLSIMSFDSYGDVNSRKDAFINHLISTLKSEGVDVGSGVIVNNKDNSKIKAQLDPLRSIKVKKDKTNPIEYFGSSSCLRIQRYSKEFTIEIPIATKNEGGIQQTAQGDFKEDPTYKVKNALTSFYTSINSLDGVKGIRLMGELDSSKLDGNLGTSMYCNSRSEKFGIQGNIYDDIRADETDKHDDDWDF
jgi:hypothetical protein